MIPRLKPYFNQHEIGAFLKHNQLAVSEFEKAFARKFQCVDAVAFPYGRSALWAFLQSQSMEGKQIIQPAYTCSVVAHATVLSGNTPVFVDNSLFDYNMQLEGLEAAITADTLAVIPTHIFGYPVDIQSVQKIVKTAQNRYGHKIWIIQDCAHSFGASFEGTLVINAGDCALFGLGISKIISSVFGGMMTFQDSKLADRVRAYRDEHFHPTSWLKTIKRLAYLLAVYPAFNDGFYGMVYWMQEKTAILNRLTKAYHLDEEIRFPPDAMEQLLPSEAAVGLVQLEKYDAMIQRRREIAAYYNEHLKVPKEWVLPPLVEGATYSHYAIRVPEREETINKLASKGIQAGRVIEYSIPHLKSYQSYTRGIGFSHAELCSRSMINLPIHPSLQDEQIERIAACVNTLK